MAITKYRIERLKKEQIATLKIGNHLLGTGPIDQLVSKARTMAEKNGDSAEVHVKNGTERTTWKFDRFLGRPEHKNLGLDVPLSWSKFAHDDPNWVFV